MTRLNSALGAIAILVVTVAIAACGPAATPTPQLMIGAPAEVAAGADVVVSWSGVPGRGDYLTIVPKGATRTHDEPYVDVHAGTPSVTLTAPATAGEYEIWFVEGDTVDKVKSRLPLKVT